MLNSTLNTTLTTNEFYVLLALADKNLHGYGIRDQIAHDSDSILVLAPGAMYPLLGRLLKKNLVQRLEVDDSILISARYRLTEFGRRTLKREITRLERAISHAHYKLGRNFTKS